jgi:hypothetical protein
MTVDQGFALHPGAAQDILVLVSHGELRPEKVNEDEDREARAFGGAGVSPVVLRIFWTMETRRRDAGATKSA